MNEKYDLHTESQYEILKPISIWLSRWGTLILLLVLLILLLLANTVKITDSFESGTLIKCDVNNISQPLYAESPIPQNLAWRIKKGNPVILRLLGYPEFEFGALSGTVDSVYSENNQKDHLQFYALVRLNTGYRSSNGTTLKPQCGQQAVATIVYRKKTILQKILNR